MKVNFIVEHLGSSQLAYSLIRACNTLAAEGEFAPIIFYDKLTRRVLPPHFPTMQLVEAWAQPGITIATSIDTAIDLINFPGPKHKVFYVWDLDWMAAPQRAWGVLSDLFTHEDLTLIARNTDHARAIQTAFNVTPKYEIDNCQVDALKEVLRQWKS